MTFIIQSLIFFVIKYPWPKRVINVVSEDRSNALYKEHEYEEHDINNGPSILFRNLTLCDFSDYPGRLFSPIIHCNIFVVSKIELTYEFFFQYFFCKKN